MYIIVSEDGKLFEKYTSTIRPFGGQLRTTAFINDAKRITRLTDAEKRVKVINHDFRRTDPLFSKSHNLPIFKVLKLND
jgi:hypothetical protein